MKHSTDELNLCLEIGSKSCSSRSWKCLSMWGLKSQLNRDTTSVNWKPIDRLIGIDEAAEGW